MVVQEHAFDELLQLTVAEALRRWPSAAQVFITLRMACVGCAFSGFDTVREALEAHNIPSERMLAALRPTLEANSFNADTPSHPGGTR